MTENHSANHDAVYFNGAITSASEARLPINDRGVLFGFGFFETFRTSGGRPHHWRFHRQRLERACAMTQIALPKSFLAADEERLGQVIHELLQRHRLKDAVFRYTVTAGAERNGLEPRPNEFLVLRPLPNECPEEGICVRVLNQTRDNGEWVPRPKSLNYGNALLGSAELKRRAKAVFDEGLFLSRDGGFVVETARQNIAWIADGRLCYPEPSLGAIAGTCLEWMLDLGVPNESRRAPVDALLTADAIVVTNSVRGITPVNLVYDRDDRPVRVGLDSVNHPIVATLRRQWIEALEATAED